MTTVTDYRAVCHLTGSDERFDETISIPDQRTSLMTQRRARNWLQNHLESKDGDLEVQLYNHAGLVAFGKRTQGQFFPTGEWTYP